MEMTKELLKKICREDKLYSTPSLNDKLYLNYKGFTSIGGLEEYTGLKAIFLEGNALDKIAFPPLPELRCLYLQQNMIWEMSGFENVPHLDSLNLSNNNITKVSHLANLPVLSTLQLAHNRLESIESIENLTECPSITSLDLSHNKIIDPEVVDRVLKRLPKLACLYLVGNPVVSHVKNYRKTLISSIPSLTYLDDRPVFELERRCAEAWAVGGLEAERAAREGFKREEKEREEKNFEWMRQSRAEAFRKRREMLGLPPGDTDPALDGYSDEEGVWQEEEEPAELVAAREKLAAFSARVGEEEPREVTMARAQLAAGGGEIAEVTWAPLEKEGGEPSTPEEDEVKGEEDNKGDTTHDAAVSVLDTLD